MNLTPNNSFAQNRILRLGGDSIPANALLTEDGNAITTEDGDTLTDETDP